jgi:hypothetical protein
VATAKSFIILSILKTAPEHVAAQDKAGCFVNFKFLSGSILGYNQTCKTTTLGEAF